MQIQIIYHATAFEMISFLILFLEDINDQKSIFFLNKKYLWPEQRDCNSKRAEDGNNWPTSKTRFCWKILLKTAVNFSNKGDIPLKVTCHMTFQIWFHCHLCFQKYNQ